MATTLSEIARSVKIWVDYDGLVLIPCTEAGNTTLQPAYKILYEDLKIIKLDKLSEHDDTILVHGIVGIISVSKSLLVITEIEQVARLPSFQEEEPSSAVNLVKGVRLISLSSRSASQDSIAQLRDPKLYAATVDSVAASGQSLPNGDKDNASKKSNSTMHDASSSTASLDSFDSSSSPRYGSFTSSSNKLTAIDTLKTVSGSPTRPTNASATRAKSRSLVSKLDSTLEAMFSSFGFYYCLDFDITRSISLQYQHNRPKNDLLCNLRRNYIYNKRLNEKFQDTPFYLPLMQGFIGTFKVSDKASVFLISRRSTNHAGVRYLRRGIDDQGHCANWIETEQSLIVSASKTGTEQGLICSSHIQLRGSIPLFFSQNSFKLHPTPRLTRKLDSAFPVFQKHFDKIKANYGNVYCVSLVEKSGREAEIGRAYETMAHKANIKFEWFDFHKECRGLKGPDQIVDDTPVGEFLKDMEWTDNTGRKQQGVIRTNCIDCLDRTNVIQTTFALNILTWQLAERGIQIDSNFEKQFKGLWADNGDAISRQYSSTAALKGDYTRTGQRNYKGIFTDAVLTLTRYFQAALNDFWAQAVIDYVLGNISDKTLLSYEETFVSPDPRMWMPTLRETCIDIASNIVVGEDSDEEVIGGWWVLSPDTNSYNDNNDTLEQQQDPQYLATRDMQEYILLVTDKALYLCKFILQEERVADFIRVLASDVVYIRYGTFYTKQEIIGDKQVEHEPQGMLIEYRSKSKDDINVATTIRTMAIKFLVRTESSETKIIAGQICSLCTDADVMNGAVIVSYDQAKAARNVFDHVGLQLKRILWG